jgi:hypothetical protein
MGRPDVQASASDDKIAAFIGQAPDERAATAPAAPAAAPAAAAEPQQDKLPAKLRKAKIPVKLTLQGELLEDFDRMAGRLGLSRAAAVGMAMRLWIEDEEKKRGK